MTKSRKISICGDAREIALDIIYDIAEQGAYANLILDKCLKNSHLSSDNRHLVTEIVNGTIRMLKHLDWVLNLFLKRPIERQNPWLRNILRMALYQLRFMDKIPAYAAVNSAVDLTSKKADNKLAAVCNGVLRTIMRNPDRIIFPPPEKAVDFLSIYYSHPEWLVNDWLQLYGREETEKILAYNNQPGALTLRTNKLKITRDELIAKLECDNITVRMMEQVPEAIKIESADRAVSEWPAFQEGYFYIQDVASMLAAPILRAQADEVVYDLGCGVGGKCTHIAEYMSNQGQIQAYDIYVQKLKLLDYNCKRLGISIINGYQQDVLDIESGYPKAFRVLLDAPCSGLGVLNRRPDLRWKKTALEINRLKQLQEELINKAGSLVEKNGVLVYSTCTINKEENEQVVSKFLKYHPEFKLEGFQDSISYFPLTAEDQDGAAAGMLTILPGHYETDGMFYACLRRI